MPDLELIAPDVAQLIVLFSAQPDLRFPELDAKVLHEAVARVKESSVGVAEAEASLHAAKAALEREQEVLLRLAQRTHAYLKVFAESDERLSERVDAISLPRARRSGPAARVESGSELGAAPKRRGRPKNDPSAQSLFEEQAAQSATAR